MKHCRDGWKEKCMKIYFDNIDYDCCPYCGSDIVMTLPYKTYFDKEYIYFGSNYFGNGNEDLFDLIKKLENNGVINIMITEIDDDYKKSEEEDWYSATLIFEITGKTDMEKLKKDIEIYHPDEFDDVSKYKIFKIRDGKTFRLWWD